MTRETLELIALSFADDGMSYEQREAMRRILATDAALRAERDEIALRRSETVAMCEQLQQECDDLREKYRCLVAFYDEHVGTPCEEIRHKQEVDMLKEQLRAIQDTVGEENWSLRKKLADLKKWPHCEECNLPLQDQGTPNGFVCLLCDVKVRLAESEQLQQERDALREEVQKWKRIRTPTHGNCCTCQACGLEHDDCRCDLDDLADQNAALSRRLAESEQAGLTRRDNSKSELREIMQREREAVWKEAMPYITNEAYRFECEQKARELTQQEDV